jgi:predicted transcriptional regulator
MARKRWSAKALAERQRRAMHLHLAGFTQEEIAEQLGVERSMICRDLQPLRNLSLTQRREGAKNSP